MDVDKFIEVITGLNEGLTGDHVEIMKVKYFIVKHGKALVNVKKLIEDSSS